MKLPKILRWKHRLGLRLRQVTRSGGKTRQQLEAEGCKTVTTGDSSVTSTTAGIKTGTGPTITTMTARMATGDIMTVTSGLIITWIRIINMNMTTDIMREPTPEVAEEDGEMIEEVRETIKKKGVGEMIEEVGEVGLEGVSGETGIMQETEGIRIRMSPPVQILRLFLKVLHIFI